MALLMLASRSNRGEMESVVSKYYQSSLSLSLTHSSLPHPPRTHRGCPGILSYHISAEACHQLLQSGRLESCCAKEEGVEGEGKKKPRKSGVLLE